MKTRRVIGTILLVLFFQSCGGTVDFDPINGQEFVISYDNPNSLFAGEISVVYCFDYWGTKGNNYQGADGLFTNVISPDSGRATEVKMESVDGRWEARILIPDDVTLLSYYFTDGEKYDYNEKKTYTRYVYNEAGIPIRNSRFRNIDFLVMAGASPKAILDELKAEVESYPTNWTAHTVYWRKAFEVCQTFNEISVVYDEANKAYKQLVETHGESDDVKLVKANYLNDYMEPV